MPVARIYLLLGLSMSYTAATKFTFRVAAEPSFASDGQLSTWYQGIDEALRSHPSAVAAAGPTGALSRWAFMGIDVGCEANWPHYGFYEDDANYQVGDAKSCRATRSARLLRWFEQETAAGLRNSSRYVVFDMFGVMHLQPPELREDARVSFAGPGFSEYSYREGVDIAFPPLPIVRPPPPSPPPLVLEQAGVEVGCSSDQRNWKHLATFKGTDTAAVRRNLVKLHDGKDFVVLLKPFKEAVSAAGYGDSSEPSSLAADYLELLATTRFALVPRGDNPYSYRLFEAICAGAVPVILSDDWVLPFSEPGGVDYDAFSIRVPESAWAGLRDHLQAFGDAAVCRMQRAALSACARHFGSPRAQVDTLLSILARRDGQDLPPRRANPHQEL